MNERDFKIISITKDIYPFLNDRLSFIFEKDIKRAILEFKYLLISMCDIDENFNNIKNVENNFKLSNSDLQEIINRVEIDNNFKNLVDDIMLNIKECESDINSIDKKMVCEFLRKSLPLIYNPNQFLEKINSENHYLQKVQDIIDMYLLPFEVYGNDFLCCCKKYVLANLAENEAFLHKQNILKIFKKIYGNEKDYKEKKVILFELINQCISNIKNLIF